MATLVPWWYLKFQLLFGPGTQRRYASRPAATPMGYDALVFDNDCVLTTPTRTAPLERAIERGFGNRGVEDPSPEDVRALLSPTRADLEAVAGRYSVLPDRPWAARERAAIQVQREEIERGEKTPYDDVEAIRGLATPRAIVSNNQHETIATIVDHFDLEGFDPWLGREPTVAGIERKKRDLTISSRP